MVENDTTGNLKKLICQYCWKNLATFLASDGKKME
jgi:hypothetical protein